MLDRGWARAGNLALRHPDGNNDRLNSAMQLPHSPRSRSVLRPDAAIVRLIGAPVAGSKAIYR